MKNQDDSDIEKRLLLAILLSMAILFVTPYIYRQFFPAPAETGVPAESQERVQPSDEPAAVETPVEEEPPVEATAESMPAGPVTSAEARIIEVDTGRAILRINNAGARIESIRLLEFSDAEGNPLELIAQVAPPEFPRPLQIELEDGVLEERLSGAVFEVSGASGDQIRAPAELVFTYRDAEIQVERTIAFEEGLQLTVRTDIVRSGRRIPYGVYLGAGLGEVDAQERDFLYPGVAYYLGGEVDRYELDDLVEGRVQVEGNARWVALDARFFAIVGIGPASIQSLQMDAREWLHSPEGEEAAEAETQLATAAVGLNPGSEFDLYFGPKRQEDLREADATLDLLIDYGWFEILVRPLLAALKFIYSYVQNYGWAIIILTFLINLALFPVRYKQIASMQKMSTLQPKLRSIQDKYKRMKRDDPRKQQMNAEVMALYKEHGVNPLGGCLPLVFQMPILFAFYRMLEAAIELRGAPFIFWIDDLSRHDPYYITPLIMGATMVAQQKMTPATGDPTQRRMMMVLPVVFTFFFLTLSSGLVVYFLFSNLFAMIFQLALQKLKPELKKGETKAKAKGKGKKN